MSKPYDRRRSRSPQGGGLSYRSRPQDNGYGSRGGGSGSGSRREEESGGGSSSKKRYDPRDDRDKDLRPKREGRDKDRGSYTARDREDERRNDRGRYEERARGDRRGGGDDDDAPPERAKSPPKPNFKPSGLLAAETNTIQVTKPGENGELTTGVILKYNEPPEARKPTRNWRLYVFKGKEQVEMIHIHRQSAYLLGRDRIISDIPISHPSASKQHAVIQFRQITTKNEFGDTSTGIKPFVIDLDSTNGTFVNDVEIPTSRYYELRQSDILRFATSSREYVVMCEEATAD